MTEAPSRSIRLFGTDEPVAPVRVLTAGQLSAELESGNLRYIRYGGIEMIRAVSFIVRDRNWGTYNPEITNLAVSETADGFRVSYDAVTKDAAQEFRYSSVITGSADGTLRFAARGRAVNDFVTNRTGFVVLHPIAGVAGEAATVETVDGKTSATTFPDLIEPAQPMMNLRAITHGFAPGATVTCRMEGDTYEMEDQRNWTDASYKTYVRPLALPWPYTLPAGTELEQAVILTVKATAPVTPRGDAPVSVRVGGAAGTLPPIGIGLDPQDAGPVPDALRALAPAHVICHHDARRGHDAQTLAKSVAFAKALGATPWLEAVVTGLDGFAGEIAALGAAVRDLGSPFPVVLVSPAPDLKCTLPGSKWPPCPPAAEIYRAARATFPAARLGGGMFSYFTELNRKRPPHDLLDLVCFTTSAMVHAGDDRSVTEGLESLPHIARSVRAFIGGKPYAVGPSAIGMRANPYGEAPFDNPRNIRQAMSYNDPRQRGLLGAAWNLGYIAHFAYGGAASITLGGGTGAFGLVHANAAWEQPWFDANGGVFPAYQVVRGLARLAGGTLQAL
ncbi:MAG: hypothetical protein JO255_09510, partial [Alphaproteobacteria bacterium]|nr:hypothetical protein [Alphaproteobacteria bacterium]